MATQPSFVKFSGGLELTSKLLTVALPHSTQAPGPESSPPRPPQPLAPPVDVSSPVSSAPCFRSQSPRPGLPPHHLTEPPRRPSSFLSLPQHVLWPRISADLPGQRLARWKLRIGGGLDAKRKDVNIH